MNSSVQDKLEKEKQALATQMQSGSKELEEKMARDEELRRQEAEALKVTGYIQPWNFAYIRLLNKPYENEVTLTEQNPHSKCCQHLET